MSGFNRREFLQASSASIVFGKVRLGDASDTLPQITGSGQTLRVAGSNYVWEWSQETGRFRISDFEGHLLVSGPLQPAVVVEPAGQKGERRAAAGRLAGHEVHGSRATWNFEGVNGSAGLTVTWRFDQRGPWVEPVAYRSSTPEDVVSLNYFSQADGDHSSPALEVHNLVVPGMSMSPAISPMANYIMNWDLTTSIGRCALKGAGLEQQWGLPVHYFCGYRDHAASVPVPDEGPCQAFCCGLAELPSGDLLFTQAQGRANLRLELRGDLWGHLRGPGRFTLGATLFWTFGPNFYEATRQYYLGLIDAGIVKPKTNSARKNAVALAPQWCTWGEQMVRHKDGRRFDEAALTTMYEELRASGLQAQIFSIDDKWEGAYGSLEHDAQRFPHFEAFLERLRADGHRLGMWAAFMRSEDPASLGLATGDMLRGANNQPYKHGSYYLLDFTRPRVAEVLRERARKFMRRYKPDLVKFDFGYEIPALDAVAPQDMNWAGERMLSKGLEVVTGAMREENPEIVVMYYTLSPLFTEHLDLHSPDDMFMAKGEYELEANRRYFFSSLCGEYGMPTYGSSGYDWISGPSAWFDSVVIGTVGAIGSFYGSTAPGDGPTPERLAKYNGLTHLVRPGNQFSVIPLDADFWSPSRGAHASSWARTEKGEVVLVALRKQRLEGSAGTGKFRDLATTTASVVAASLTGDSLARTGRLGIVPYGDGEITIQRDGTQAGHAEVIEHCWGGKSAKSQVPIRASMLTLPLRERGENGLVEWLEVDMRS